MRQAGLLAAHLEEPADGALVLMGDLNEWLPAGGIRDALAESYGPHPSLSTFPAIRPVAGFDQVWVSPRRCLVRLEVHQSRLARVASDHLPVRAIVNLSLRTAAASSAA
jgi:endonuclease/exonuclease/phosphatase family metal-dependent hydrolase